MLPRRTRRLTSLTAKNPANSLVNPWVSRMNSSANRISPIGLRKRCPVRAQPTSLNWLVPGRLGIRPGRPPLRAGICRQWAGLCKAQSWTCDRAARTPRPQLVELPERLTDLRGFADDVLQQQARINALG